MGLRLGSFHAAVAASAVIALAACGNPMGPGFIVANEPGRIVMALGDTEKRWRTDPITIDSGRIERDTLVLSVSHGGGCAEHEYALVASNGWMESSPVQLGVLLAHDAKGDVCKALLRRALKFDLRPARDAYASAYARGSGSGEFIMVIRGSDPSGTSPALRVLYRF